MGNTRAAFEDLSHARMLSTQITTTSWYTAMLGLVLASLGGRASEHDALRLRPGYADLGYTLKGSRTRHRCEVASLAFESMRFRIGRLTKLQSCVSSTGYDVVCAGLLVHIAPKTRSSLLRSNGVQI